MKAEKTKADLKQTSLKENTGQITEKKNQWRNKLGNLLMILGLVVIAIPFVGRYLADQQQEKMIKEFYDQIDGQILEEGEKLNQTLAYTDDENLQADLNASAKEIAEISLHEGLDTNTVTKLSTGPSAIGIIDIPKINLKYPIAEGVDDATLRFAIGHMPGSAGLGSYGNSVLAGHRSHSFGDFFNRLDELGLGDVITISHQTDTTTYRVVEKKRVHKTDLSVLISNQNEQELTLITCELGMNPEDRIIIKAKVDQVPEPETKPSEETS